MNDILIFVKMLFRQKHKLFTANNYHHAPVSETAVSLIFSLAFFKFYMFVKTKKKKAHK